VIDELQRELTAVGIRGERRRRILDEIADHLACDPGADLGEPSELSRQFADELGTSLARRAAAWTFVALAGTAALLLLPQLLIDSYPDVAAGRSTVLAGVAALAMFVGAQLGFVAGSLAALRAWRVRGELAVPAAEVRLLRRRSVVGSFAGLVAAGGVALYVVNFSAELPARSSLVSLLCASVSGVLLVSASLAVARGGRLVVSVEGDAGGTARDVGAARLAPPAIALLVGAAAVTFALTSGWVVEGSLAEGVVRGVVEAVAFAGCWLAFGRSLGVRDA
jgi:hypothetical protein